MIGAARRLLRHPPRLWVPLLLHRASRFARQMVDGMHDAVLPSYSNSCGRAVLRPRIEVTAHAFAAVAPAWLGSVCDLFLAHRFDWLGLGWRRVDYGVTAPGLGGHRYDPPCPVPDQVGDWLAAALPTTLRYQARTLWCMIEWPYRPIDWQRDHRSGYRWDEGRAARNLSLQPAPGVDVKQPWELARLQQLPLLALAHASAVAGAAGFAPARRYASEFRNVVLDFAASNPPRYGVNWSCSMDVAIRVGNILLAWDLLRAGGAQLGADFERVLADIVVDHGIHIRRNLEKRPDFAANHYLANLAGLLFAAVYVNGYAPADEWRSVCLRELAREIPRQFATDGSNFEASVGYHRLSGEICIYAIALMQGEAARELSALPAAAIIEGVANFTAGVIRPNGIAAPIGDLDGGRFMRISTNFDSGSVEAALAKYLHLEGGPLKQDRIFWDERLDQHAHLIAACSSLLEGLPVDASCETKVLVSLSRGGRLTRLSPKVLVASRRVDGSNPDGFTLAGTGKVPPRSTRTYTFALGDGVPELLAYRDFGLYIVRAESWHLTIRCGVVGQNGNGGHAHNDQLSLTLYAGGCQHVEDPGVHVYGALPNVRNAYRSVTAHFSPRPASGEPADLGLGAFRLPTTGEGTCKWFGPDGFVGVHEGFGYPVMRVVRWNGGILSVHDASWGEPLIDLLDGSRWSAPVPLSIKYGCPQAC